MRSGWAAVGALVHDQALKTSLAFEVVGLYPPQTVGDAGDAARLAVGRDGLRQVLEAIVQALLVAVLDDARAGLGRFVLVGVAWTASVTVGHQTTMLPGKFAHALACAVVHADELAVAVARRDCYPVYKLYPIFKLSLYPRGGPRSLVFFLPCFSGIKKLV